MTVFWHVGIPEDGGSRIFRNVGISMLGHVVSQPKDQSIITTYLFCTNFSVLHSKSHLIIIPLGLLFYHISKFSASQHSNSIITKDFSVCSLAQAVQLTISVGVLFSYALQMYVPIEILWPKIQKRWGPFKYSSVTEILFRSSLVFITCKCFV